MRGKRGNPRGYGGRQGSIPARAGETRLWIRSPHLRKVHPRACGGNSPRTRQRYLEQGSIPARAGETRRGPGSATSSRVHPRACGGNGRSLARRAWDAGPSPRVRGKRQKQQVVRCLKGSIPARAGETPIDSGSSAMLRVHPRACGGNSVARIYDLRRWGPSPRVRGKRQLAARAVAHEGSIPARAGETSGERRGRQVRWVHPRACGGNPVRTQTRTGRRGPSPRVRGKRSRSAHQPPTERSIPARAGETRSRYG